MTVKGAKVVPARYDAECPKCGKQVEGPKPEQNLEGQLITKSKLPGSSKGRWHHLNCDEPDENRPIASEADTDPEPSNGEVDLTPIKRDVETFKTKVRAELLKAATAIGTDVAEKLEQSVDALTEKVGKKSAELIAEEMRKINEKLAKRIKPREIVLKDLRTDQKRLLGRTHEKFPEVLFYLRLGLNVMMVGPAGSGKTFVGAQLAKALDLAYAHISGSTGVTESQVLGRSVPNVSTGEDRYVRSPFVRHYEEGGVYLFDEFDAMDPNVQVSINAGLANGKLSVPNRMNNPVADRHADFYCVLACNTFGEGPDRQYVGRNPMDAATRDRFVVVEINYDRELERDICTGILGSDEFAKKLWDIRGKIEQARMERVVSTRMIERGATIIKGLESDDLGANLYSDERRMKFAIDVLTRGWSDDDKRVALP